MNWKQKTCLVIGILVAVGMFVYPPVEIAVTSLRFYLGDPNAGMIFYNVYRFMPECGLRAINWALLCVQWFIVAVISSFLIYLFRENTIKYLYNAMKTEKRLSYTIAFCFGSLGSILCLVTVSKYFVTVRMVAPMWFDIFMYNIALIAGAIIGFYLIWFMVWFIYKLLSGVFLAFAAKRQKPGQNNK